MGKISFARSVISRGMKAANVVSKIPSVTNTASKIAGFDVNKISNFTSGTGMDVNILSNLQSDPKMASALNKFSNVQSILNSGPASDVIKAVDKVQNNAVVKEIGKAVDSAKSKGNEFIGVVKEKVVEEVSSAGIQNNPIVAKTASDLKGKLNKTGIDVDKYIDMYKNSQE